MQLKYISAILFFAIVHVSASPSPSSEETTINCHTQTDCPAGYRCCGPFRAELGGTCFGGPSHICPL
ncbi:hypothetical protein BDZ94DRAFT_1253929 [Collybia nuda]|uniref:Uncharacterized protein n=1 Tax=Collybia nuda TaxID=64659 RepID=A0A9P6CM20_9AGAR|nr:hypothetical protein BDZ94DRAFT_1253929 [Collybia nuda]